jgi:2-amino-4-hydroxy-6-hydroxymethyldihydropteridine diphosphokinase
MRGNNIYLSLGSNEGNREILIKSAIDLINTSVGKVVKVSSVYESDPLEFNSSKKFLNTCLLLNSEANAQQLLLKLEAIEIKLGRIRKFEQDQYCDRPIDIDIIFIDDLIINLPELVVPHPKMHLRRFVLEPLAELCPDFVHPILKKTVSVLLKECPDKSKLKLTLKR